MEENTNLNILNVNENELNFFNYKKFSNFKTANNTVKNLNKLLINLNKIYSSIFHNENIKLNKKVNKKYKNDLKKGLENNWLETQIRELKELNDLEKHLLSKNLRENYLKNETINFKKINIKKILYLNKEVWKNLNILTKYTAKKIDFSINENLIEANNLINSFHKKMNQNNLLVKKWNNNKMFFNNSFNLTSDNVKNNKKDLSKILRQNERLYDKFSDLNLLSKRLFHVLDVDSELFLEKDQKKLESVLFYELSRAGIIPYSKKQNNYLEKTVRNIINESENIEKSLYDIKNQEKNAVNSFNFLLEKFKQNELFKINASILSFENTKKEIIQKLDLLKERGEILSDKIDFLTEKLRRHVIGKIIKENNLEKQSDLIISFANLRHPLLNEKIGQLSKISQEEKIASPSSFPQKSLKKQIIIFENIYDNVLSLWNLINDLRENKIIYNVSELKFGNLNKIRNPKKNSNLLLIQKKERHQGVKLKNILENQMNDINKYLNRIIEVQIDFLKKFNKPNEEGENKNIVFDFSEIGKKLKDKNLLTQNDILNFDKEKIAQKIDFLVKNQNKFFSNNNLENFNYKVINLGEKIFQHKYLDKYSNKNINVNPKKIKVSSIKRKELFKKEIAEIKGFDENKNKSIFLFDFNIEELNKIDYHEIIENREMRNDFNKIFEYFTSNSNNINEAVLEFNNLKKDINKRMAYLMEKYKTLIEVINEFNHKILVETEITKSSLESNKIILNQIEKLEEAVIKKEKDFNISKIKGVGPQTKKYLLKNNIKTVRELINYSRNNDITNFIANIPGLKNETYNAKIDKFNDFLMQANEHIKKSKEANNKKNINKN
ncbi:MAG: hypothetical protein HPAVJP_2770 [Candidatus Hepatoplasma vulgare]|nr:MAG: hypothetical protein HPAVJP_2770 [Candidatus Hepatoplasma sp.]